jgi:hypothetical protein
MDILCHAHTPMDNIDLKLLPNPPRLDNMFVRRSEVFVLQFRR